MKLSSYVFIALMFIISILGIEQLEIAKKEQMLEQQLYYNIIAKNAINDATTALKLALKESDNYHYIDSEMRTEVVVDSFKRSLANSLNITNLDMVQIYIPFILLADNEGYYIYTSYNSDNTYYNEILPKIRYCMQLEQDYYYFKANKIGKLIEQNNKLKIIYHSRDEWLKIEPSSHLSALLKNNDWELRIARIKREQIYNDLTYYVNLYNQHLASLGLYYDFELNIFDQKENKLQENFILAAIDGLPLANSVKYSKTLSRNYKLDYSQIYFGFEQNGIKYYLEKSPKNLKDREVISYFSTAYDAAAKGYFPYH